jgi:hypothetical protein
MKPSGKDFDGFVKGNGMFWVAQRIGHGWYGRVLCQFGIKEMHTQRVIQRVKES